MGMQAPTADAGAKDALEDEFNKLKGENDALAAEYEELKAVREVCGV